MKIVLNWFFEGEFLRVWVDADLILSMTSIPKGIANSWLIRFIEAIQHLDSRPCQDADDLGTDVSF